MTWAVALAEFAANNMSARARGALLDRGVSDEQIKLFQIGYLDSAVPKGLPEHFLSWASGKLDDVFVLPLTNTLGAIHGFQFRHVDRKQSGYQDYFLDRKEAALFGLGQAVEKMWETRSVYLVEGAFDLFPVQRAFPAVIATLTARPSAQTVRVLKRLVHYVWMGYDMDPTGRNGCKQFFDDHGHDFQVYIVTYPKVNGSFVKDPGELWEAWGDTQMTQFIQSVTTLDQFEAQVR